MVSHLGSDGKASLAPVVKYLNRFYPTKLIKNLEPATPRAPHFAKASRGKALERSGRWGEDGQIVLLENIRRFAGEQKNDPEFAKQLAGLADLYVNDAFSVSHRAHSSVSVITKYLPSYAGLLFLAEFKNLSLVLKPKSKMVVILGGLKFKTKIPLIKKFLKMADRIFVGGALANSFFKAQGLDIGNSIAEENINYLKPFLKEVKNSNKPNGKIILPIDTVKNKKNQIIDIGPKSLDQIKEMTKDAKLILWNGPMGWFEAGAKQGTLETAKIVAKACPAKRERSGGCISVVGGGDTLSAIKELNLLNVSKSKNQAGFSFVSTAGGAMLEFLAEGTLPGLKALDRD